MIRQFNMLLVNAFANGAFSGNTTGVVISDNLSSDEMQNIARDLQQPETVFVERLDIDRYMTRFFTPKREIELCGHATIATFYALAELGYISPIEDGVKSVIQHTNCGKTKVDIEYKHGEVSRVHMYLSDLKIENVNIEEDLEKALGISKDRIGLTMGNYVPKIVSCGNVSLVVPLKSKEDIGNIVLNEAFAEELSNRIGAMSIQVFTTKDGESVHQRTFSPAIGVAEEMASGTSTAATLYYMAEEGINKSNKSQHRQGLEADRKSDLYASYDSAKGVVKVGGQAFVYLSGVLSIK